MTKEKKSIETEKGSETSIKENWKKFLQDPWEYYLKGEWEYIKKHPFISIGTFFKWVLIFYVVMVGIQSVYFDMVYCDSSIDEYDGKLMYVWKPFVENINGMIQEISIQNRPGINYNEPIIMGYELPEMECKHDFRRWRLEGIKADEIWYNFVEISTKGEVA